jgi:hypothetical protein
MTWYVVDRDEYVASLPQIGAIYRELMGKNFPAMASWRSPPGRAGGARRDRDHAVVP